MIRSYVAEKFTWKQCCFSYPVSKKSHGYQQAIQSQDSNNHHQCPKWLRRLRSSVSWTMMILWKIEESALNDMGVALEYISFLLNITEECARDQHMQNITSLEYVDFLFGLFSLGFIQPHYSSGPSFQGYRWKPWKQYICRVACYLSRG